MLEATNKLQIQGEKKKEKKIYQEPIYERATENAWIKAQQQ